MTNLLNRLFGATRTVYSLKDLFEIGPQYGYTASSDTKKVGPRFLRITDIQGNVVDWGTVPYCQISDEEKTKYLLKKNDLVFARTGATTGMSYFVDEDLNEEAVFASYLIRLRFNEKLCDPRLLKYFFQSRNYWGQVNGSLSGSAQPGINAVTLSQMEVSLPDLPTQSKIAEILSVYDEKIENNNTIINKLEATAQTIFDEWFVDFRFPGYEKVKFIETDAGNIPEGWEEKSVLEVIERIGVGKKYDNKTALPTGNIQILDQGKSGNIGYHNEEPGVIASIENPVVVFTNHTCYYRLMTEPFSCIQNVLPYVGRNGYPTLFVYFLTKEKIKMQEYKGHWPDFERQNFILPSTIQAHKFTEKNLPFIKKIVALQKENTDLKHSRDLLLKKLI
jgi:type I restriction enzyme S subunit